MMPLTWFAFAALGVAVAAIVFARRSALGAVAKLQAAQNLASMGRTREAKKALAGLVKNRFHVVAAQASLSLAGLAAKKPDFGLMLQHCEAAFGRLRRRGARVVAADLLLPSIAAERAFALAALDRFDEANAELVTLSPAFARLARSVFRVRLVELVRRGDLGEAARYVESSSPDLPLGPREELLRDLVRASANREAAGAGELERLRDELRDPGFRRWILAVAPSVAELFERQPADDDAAVEEEAAAEAEAEAELREPKRVLAH